MIPKELYINFNFIAYHKKEQRLLDNFNETIYSIMFRNKYVRINCEKGGVRQRSSYKWSCKSIIPSGNKFLDEEEEYIKLK